MKVREYRLSLDSRGFQWGWLAFGDRDRHAAAAAGGLHHDDVLMLDAFVCFCVLK